MTQGEFIADFGRRVFKLRHDRQLAARRRRGSAGYERKVTGTGE
jgi:hypothetical protein